MLLSLLGPRSFSSLPPLVSIRFLSFEELETISSIFPAPPLPTALATQVALDQQYPIQIRKLASVSQPLQLCFRGRWFSTPPEYITLVVSPIWCGPWQLAHLSPRHSCRGLSLLFDWMRDSYSHTINLNDNNNINNNNINNKEYLLDWLFRYFLLFCLSHLCLTHL